MKNKVIVQKQPLTTKLLSSNLAQYLNAQRPEKWHSKRVKTVPTDKEYQDWEAEQMLLTAETDGFYDLELYPLSRGYHPQKFFKLRQTNEFFEQCLMMSNYLVSARLKEDAREGIISENYMFKMLPLHNPEYDEMKKAYIGQLIKEREAAKMLVIEMEKISNSSLVPERNNV